MDQIEKLLSSLSPGTLMIIKEQIATYRSGLLKEQARRESEEEEGESSEEIKEEIQQEIAWCDRISDTTKNMIEDKT